MKNVKILPLGEIVSVRTIMTFRDKAPPYDPDGNACVITIKDLLSKGPLEMSHLLTVQVTGPMLVNQLVPGEVLLPGRGDHYVAKSFHGWRQPAFPVGQINVIRPEPPLNSDYLAWYLNQADAQRFIKSALGGTGIKALSKTRLLELPIHMPAPELQERIATLQALQAERSTLLHELDNLNKQEIDISCLRLLAGEEH